LEMGSHELCARAGLKPQPSRSQLPKKLEIIGTSLQHLVK
jgi:hypothetical protein